MMNTGSRNIHVRRPARPGQGKRFFRDRSLTRRAAPREQGVTTVGFLVLAVFVGLFAFAVIRLTPVYLNYMKVVSVLNGVYDEFDGQSPTRAEIRNSISRRFGVESVGVITHREVKVVTDSGGFLVEASYDDTTPFIGNIYFTVKFEKSVLVRQ